MTWSGFVSAQDTIPKTFKPELNIRAIEPVTVDSLTDPEKVTIVISPDSIDAKVEYGSVDSNYLDNKTRKVYLYGNAYVRYKDLEIKADYIVVDLDSSIATAEGLIDSSGTLAGNPEFKMGNEPPFTAKRMRYNFQTRKGFIYDALTEEGDLYIHGEKTKFVAGGVDPDQPDAILYNKGALITSCDHPHPHYGIRAAKVKTIPDKLAVVGPSNLEIFGVPTPLILPFGFYPVPNSRQAGVIFPRDYERSPRWGFGLKEFGYYFPVKDWADVRLTGDIYFNGSWGLGANTNYVKKYKYRGAIDLRYSSRLTEPSDDYRELNEKSFSIRINHNQDAKAHPYQTIGGSVNIQSNDFESLNFNDARSALTNTYSSNFNYNRTFPGKPYSFSGSMSHSQNTRSHLVTINAPDLNFRLNRIYPFKSKSRPGPDKWFEKIAFQYSGNAKSQINTTDTTLFEASTWKNAQWGAQHR
ncbi:MAG: putative LPS assembly protein LptD, partial [Saprospiraceae bacterium]